MPSDRPCVICGEGFSPRHSLHTCCSPECQRERHRRQQRRWYAVEANKKRHRQAALRSYHKRRADRAE